MLVIRIAEYRITAFMVRIVVEFGRCCRVTFPLSQECRSKTAAVYTVLRHANVGTAEMELRTAQSEGSMC
jgi:hypothetical protein